MAKQRDVVVATVSVMTTYDGQAVMVKEGDMWDGRDPFVRDRPDLFGDLDELKVKRTRPASEYEQRPSLSSPPPRRKVG